MTHHRSEQQSTTTSDGQVASKLRRILPVVGTVVLIGYLFWSTDIEAAHAALMRADLLATVATLVGFTVAVWLFDSACLVWLIDVALGHRGEQRPMPLRQVAAIKAASYILNIVNYNAATVGMGWLVARRKKVGVVESVAALAVLSYIDLIALSALVVSGLWLAPEVLAGHDLLEQRLEAICTTVFCLALLCLVILQSGLRVGIVGRLRSLALLRPIAAISPSTMMFGVVLRMVFILLYVAANYCLMLAFGMRPDLYLLWVFIPILTVVGVVPLSISGLGTTQILMRTMYAPMVADGLDAVPVIDAYSTVMILGFILVRLLVAAPYLPAVLREMRQRQASK